MIRSKSWLDTGLNRFSGPGSPDADEFAVRVVQGDRLEVPHQQGNPPWLLLGILWSFGRQKRCPQLPIHTYITLQSYQGWLSIIDIHMGHRKMSRLAWLPLEICHRKVESFGLVLGLGVEALDAHRDGSNAPIRLVCCEALREIPDLVACLFFWLSK